MYQRILVPVDGSATSDAGVAEAVRIAKLTHGQLRLLHVVDELPLTLSAEGYGAMSSDVLQLLRDGGERTLQRVRAGVHEQKIAVDTVLCESLAGRVCDHVAQQAKEWNADLIVLGTHGRHGAGRLLLGSDAEQVLRTAPVPVLLVRAPGAA
jgi:nucleotide-binding universal stress UspA family protein